MLNFSAAGIQSRFLPSNSEQQSLSSNIMRSVVIEDRPPFQWSWFFLLGGGLCLLLGAWLLPISIGSVHPALLSEMAAGSPSVAEAGAGMARRGRRGPARMLRQAGVSAGLENFEALDVALVNSSPTNANAKLWNGRNLLLDSGLVSLSAPSLADEESAAGSLPALRALIVGANRDSLRRELSQSPSPGGAAILATRELTGWKRFSPAGSGGGQPLEATILLVALLHETGGLSPSLADEVSALAHATKKSKNLATLEAFYLDTLSLAQRLDGSTLSGLYERLPSLSSVAQYAHFANRAEADFPVVYAAALMSGNAEAVADYLVRFGNEGVGDLRQALALGEGGVNALLGKQLRISGSGSSVELGETARLAREHPSVLLVAKFAMFFLGAILVVAGWDGIRFKPEMAIASPATRLQPLRNGLVGLLFALILAAVSEPFLLKANSQTDFAAEKRILPVEQPGETPSNPEENEETGMFENLDLSTVYTILAFLLVQIIVYLICIQRIHQIDRMDESSLLKLKLMENEDNLFDAGLYVGIAGTALALVLQVMEIIQADLVAAYSSNLFGITCVALVKIRNVRPYKRRLIMASEEEGRSASPARRARPAEQGELLT